MKKKKSYISANIVFHLVLETDSNNFTLRQLEIYAHVVCASSFPLKTKPLSHSVVCGVVFILKELETVYNVPVG